MRGKPFNSESAREARAKANPKRGQSERTKLLNELFNPADAKAVYAKLIGAAKDGDMDAIKTILPYWFGKPKETMVFEDPDGNNPFDELTVKIIHTKKGDD